jgi:hypothetical protein
MQLYLINLLQLIYHLHVSKKQVHPQEAIPVLAAYSISVLAAYSITVLAAYSIPVLVAYSIPVLAAYSISHASMGV